MVTSAAISSSYEFPAAYQHEFLLSLSHIQLITILVVGLSEFFLIHLFCGFKPSIQSRDCHESSRDNRGGVVLKEEREIKRIDIQSGDVDVVLKSLGMFRSNRGEEVLSLDADDIFEVFEEVNPSLGEVKEAFDVFDKDKDGFIDAEELQKVLEALGFEEGLELENCRRMIAGFDENCDERIDFHEFVKFMEISLC